MRRIYNRVDFNETKEYIKNNKKLDFSKFDKVSEITNMIDFLNKEVEDTNNRRAGEDIASISRLLARLARSKSFYIKTK